MYDENFLTTRDCYIELYMHPVAIMIQIINCAKCFILTVNLQIDAFRFVELTMR